MICVILIIVIIIAVSVTACELINQKGNYNGEHPSLYTEAVNSLLWTHGHSWDTDFASPSEISIIEIDSYGRTLFTYYEKKGYLREVEFVSYLIAQKIEKNSIYYYEDINFIVIPFEKNSVLPALGEKDNKAIETLKADNDWETPFNENKCISKSNVKSRKEIKDRDMIEEHIVKAHNDACRFTAELLTESQNGAKLFFGSFVLKESDKRKYFVCIQQNDGEIIIQYTDVLYEYRDELANFKSENGW